MKNLFFTLALMFMTVASAQITLNDVKVPATYSTGEDNLVLNGAGIRTKYIFKVYVGALYLEKKTKNLTEVLKSNQAIAVNMHITSSLLTEKKMYDAIKEGFEKSTPNPSATLKGKINKFLSDVVKNKVKEGDIFSVYYLKNSETVKVSVNGKVIHTVQGKDFRNAIFGIWIGSNPITTDLKKAMAGG